MTSRVTSGNDVNAFGIRAHDGTPGSGGTELNVYATSFHIVGINDNGRSRDYANYPYVTSGCSADVNDFDWDAAGGYPYGTVSLTSRTGAFTHDNTTMSDNDSWQGTSFNGWTSDSGAHDYGIWTGGVRIEDTGESNYGIVYLGNFAASPPPPTSQPEANTFRIYLPTDAGGAPTKPYVKQYLTHLSGPNPIQTDQTTRVRVTVEVVNPVGSMGSITFSSPTDVVTAYVPGGEAVYADNATATGTIVSQPVVGGSGNVVWDPGMVASGSTATLNYEVDVTPLAPGRWIAVTGSPGSNGTTAQYLDETGNGSQSRATYTWGPLCELAVSESATTAITLASLTARSRSDATAPIPLSLLLAIVAPTAMVAASTGMLVAWRRKQRSSVWLTNAN
jgi:hypothetical protein